MDLLFKNHTKKNVATFGDALLAKATLAEVRFDDDQHLVKITDKRAVCKMCKQRTTFRCMQCNVALHPSNCFYNFHTMESI